MKKSKLLALILAVVCCASTMLSCEKDEKTQNNQSSNEKGETAQTDAPLESAAPTQSPITYGGNPNGDEVGDDVYIGSVKIFPDIPETNPGVNFGVLSRFEDAPVEVLGLNLATMRESVGENWAVRGVDKDSKEKDGYGRKRFIEYTGDFFFYGHMVDEYLFMEVAEDNYLMKSSTLLTEINRIYQSEIKGLCAYKEYMNPEMYSYSFYAGINFDMTRSDIESILGEGIEGTPYSEETKTYRENEKLVHNLTPIMYRGGDTAFVVCYENDAPMRFFVLKR